MPQPDPAPRRPPSSAAMVGALMGGTGPAFQAAQEAASGETLNATVTATPPPEGSSPTMAQMLAAKQKAEPSPLAGLSLSDADRIKFVSLQTQEKVLLVTKSLWPNDWTWHDDQYLQETVKYEQGMIIEKGMRKADRKKELKVLEGLFK
jgi:hypothetical protein